MAQGFDWTPTEDRVVVKPIEESDVSEGGILIAPMAKEKPIRGTVVAVGSGRVLETGSRVEIPFGIGDEVLFGRYSGLEFAVPGLKEKHLVMRANEVALYRRLGL